jgi:hypothetical protein
MVPTCVGAEEAFGGRIGFTIVAMKPRYSSALVIGAVSGLVLSLCLVAFITAYGGVPSLIAVVDGSDVVPTLSAAASATWIMVILAGIVGGLILSISTYGVARVLEPEASSAPLAVVAPLGSIIGAVIGMVVFPLGITVVGSISEGSAIIGVSNLVILAGVVGIVAGAIVTWLTYVLARPSTPAVDPELLAA